MNLANFLVSVIAYFLGKEFLNVFMLLLMVESAFILIIGGVYGSLISSASFHGLDRYLRRKETERTQEEKNERETVKREVKMGKRFVILGAVLFLESILIAFSLML